MCIMYIMYYSFLKNCLNENQCFKLLKFLACHDHTLFVSLMLIYCYFICNVKKCEIIGNSLKQLVIMIKTS